MCHMCEDEKLTLAGWRGGVGRPVEKDGIFHVDLDEKVALNGLQRNREERPH